MDKKLHLLDKGEENDLRGVHVRVSAIIIV